MKVQCYSFPLFNAVLLDVILALSTYFSVVVHASIYKPYKNLSDKKKKWVSKYCLFIEHQLTFCYQVFCAQCAAQIKENENGGLGLVVMVLWGS